MNFQQRSNGTGRVRGRIFLIALFLILALMIAPGPLGGIAAFVFAPLHNLASYLKTSTHPVPSYFRDRMTLAGEIDRLSAENAVLKEESVRAHVLAEELARVGAMPEGGSRILADVVRTPPQTPYDTIILAAGERDGVERGALVYAGASAIGEVARVYADMSVAVLFSTAGMKLPVYLWGADIFAHAEGMGGGVIRIGVPQGLNVRDGDAVTVPVRGTAVFGTVSHIESDPTNPLQYAYVMHDESLRSLRFVLIDREARTEISNDEALAAISDLRTNVISSPLVPLLDTLPLATTTASTTSQVSPATSTAP